MLLNAHVAHLHFVNQLVDRHSFSAFERVKNFQPLGAADLCEQSLIHGVLGKRIAEFTRPDL